MLLALLVDNVSLPPSVGDLRQQAARTCFHCTVYVEERYWEVGCTLNYGGAQNAERGDKAHASLLGRCASSLTCTDGLLVDGRQREGDSKTEGGNGRQNPHLAPVSPTCPPPASYCFPLYSITYANTTTHSDSTNTKLPDTTTEHNAQHLSHTNPQSPKPL